MIAMASVGLSGFFGSEGSGALLVFKGGMWKDHSCGYLMMLILKNGICGYKGLLVLELEQVNFVQLVWQLYFI